MAGKALPMKLMVSVMAFVAGEAMNVSRVCREAGVSRKTFYKYVQRCRDEGGGDVLVGAAFEERSRRPHSLPNAVLADVEDEVVKLRKQLDDAGVDHGATTIQWHLGRDGRFKGRVPSVATVHRILVRRGFVVAQPHKRPKSSYRRFEAPAPTEWWQIDATDWVIAGGPVKIFNIIDDHSRLACRSRVVTEATAAEAWTTFSQAGCRWGLPAGVLSDNGLCFSGKLRGIEVTFEAKLRDAGIRPFTGRAYHPETTGKVERFQQTLKKWLRRQERCRGVSADLAELQARLDEFCDYYNTRRPHQGIGRVTPLSRWQASPAATAADEPLAHPAPRSEPRLLTVRADGVVKVDHWLIGLGKEWGRCDAIVIIDQRYATVFVDSNLVRHLKLDPKRTYQPTGRPRGPRPHRVAL